MGLGFVDVDRHGLYYGLSNGLGQTCQAYENTMKVFVIVHLTQVRQMHKISAIPVIV